MPAQGGIKKLLDHAIEKKASDLHIMADAPPMVRIDGKLIAINGEENTNEEKSEGYVNNLLNTEQQAKLKADRELDFSFGYRDTRFRVNVFFQKNGVSAALRLIPSKIRKFSDLGLPPILEKFTLASQGLVVITGPTGHGKSTTLAAMVDYMNTTRCSHIITIEDPIEYVFEHDKSIITQREVGSDTHSFARALRSSFREDPDVIMVGEMRDLETIEAVLTLAETGHLVVTTLHTNSASQTADRIVDVFPPHQQPQIRSQLASVILGVVSQRLIPRTNGGRVVACEIMVVNNAVKNIIREGKTHQLGNIIQTSASEGMISLDKVLAEFVNKGDITVDDALTWTMDPKAFKMMVY